MGRTSLFGALRRAMSKAHAVNLTGLSPDQLAQRAISRRGVLKGMGAAAMVPLVPKLAGCGDNVTIPPVAVAIVGGGMAGLHCAYRLHEVGVIAQVYEASSDRTGGRIFTGRDLPGIGGGQLVELGGELIDSDHTTMMGLAAELSQPLDDLRQVTTGLVQDTFHFNGGIIDEADIVTAFTPLAAIMDTTVATAEEDDDLFATVDAMSIPEWLATEGGVGMNSLIHKILVEAYRGEYGLEPDEQSIFNLLYLIDYATPDPFRIFGDSDEAFHTHSGNDSITAGLAAGLEPDQIKLGYRLTKVERRLDQYALTFTVGGGASEEVVVDHVVFALPFTALRQVDLTAAGITAEKQDIIDNLGYGTNAKLMLQFTTPVWRAAPSMAAGGSFTDVGDLQSTWDTSRGQGGTQGILTNFVGGTRGIDIGAGTAEERAAEVLPWIDTVFPGTEAAYVAGSAVRKHWPTEPNHMGSYACYKVNQWSYFGLEGRRNGNLHFCGEHCSEDYQGYMEGAAETGAGAALEILADLDVQPSARLQALMAPRAALPHASFNGPARPLRRNQRRRILRSSKTR